MPLPHCEGVGGRASYRRHSSSAASMAAAVRCARVRSRARQRGGGRVPRRVVVEHVDHADHVDHAEHHEHNF